MLVEKTKLGLVTATEQSRYAINGIYLDAKEQRAIATDGKMLVSLPCDFDKKEKSAIVSREAWGEKLPRGEALLLNLDKDHATMKSGRRIEYIQGQYPNWKEIIPKHKYTVKLVLNPKMLLDLAQAMGYNADNIHVQLEIPVPDDLNDNVKDAIKVTNARHFDAGDHKALGIIMSVSKL